MRMKKKKGYCNSDTMITIIASIIFGVFNQNFT